MWINDIDIKYCTRNTSKKKGLKTPQIFHWYWVFCCTILENYANIACSLAVYPEFWFMCNLNNLNNIFQGSKWIIQWTIILCKLYIHPQLWWRELPNINNSIRETIQSLLDCAIQSKSLTFKPSMRECVCKTLGSVPFVSD